MSKQIFDTTSDGTLKGQALNALSQYNAGTQAFATLTMTGVVVDTETFEIGEDTYEIHDIQTSTTADVDTGGITADDVIIPTDIAHGVTAGETILLESEFCIVLTVPSTTSLTVLRGAYGSTAATHAAGILIYKAAAPVAAGNLAIPFAGTLSAAVADGFIVLAHAFWQAGYNPNIGPGRGITLAAVTKSTAQNSAVGTIVHFFAAGFAGESTLATDMTNATATDCSAEVEVGTAVGADIVEPITDSAPTHTVCFPFTVLGVEAQLYAATGLLGATQDHTIVVDGPFVTVTEGTLIFADGQTLRITAIG